jgi:hypothetical protein
MKLHETKKLMHSKERRQPVKWEKIFASCTSYKVLLTGIYRELRKTKTKPNNKT